MMTDAWSGDPAETVFTYGAPHLKFGPGARHELGHDVAALGARRVVVVTDPGVRATGIVDDAADRLRESGLEVVIFDGARVEPTDESLDAAVAFARSEGPFDAVVAIGGGTSIDTAKAVDLMLTNEGELLDYVNPPVGGGRAPTQPLLPLVALPTTTGTGSESTTICVLDIASQRVKTGISHPRLRPTLAVVDPDVTLTQPPQVTAAAGMDICCHALESYTARAYTSGPRQPPEKRVPYCGANPIADLWAENALRLLAGSLRSAVHDGDDPEVRRRLALAATFAGLGFGNAGVHIPHACAYPVAGGVRDFVPEGYGPGGGPADHPMVPHGMAVSLTAPAAFRFTFPADPERHLRAADLLDPDHEQPGEGEDRLPGVLTALIRDLGLPLGLAAVGYEAGDVESLTAGTMKQQRLLDTAPREVSADDVAAILTASIDPR